MQLCCHQMKMEQIKEQIKRSKLLVGKVLGTLTEQQQQALQQWEHTGANQQLEDHILNATNFEQWTTEREKLDLAQQWEAFLHQMRNTRPGSRSISMQVFKRMASVAAIVVLCFSLYYGYELTVNNTDGLTVADAGIVPGSPQATLMLNGSEIVKLQAVEESIITRGDVSIENAAGVLAYTQQTKNHALQPVHNTLMIPRGGEYQLALPDGTNVWLNSDSELSYTVPFEGSERRVLLSGEAYFDVAPDHSKPFVVETRHQAIEVVGTAFNISAYPEDRQVVTTLVEGTVKVEHDTNHNSLAVHFLQPDEQLILNKETLGARKALVDPYVYTSWKDGRFAFNNEPLESFFKKVSRWYDTEIHITDERIKSIRFTGDLPRYKNMADILNILEAETSVQFEIKANKTIYVSK